MILRRLLTITILLTSTIWSQAQQINAVPDYVFRNQMSVGRNAVTDTGAYFSIGPRYGAVKGFMPPIVSDTASMNANKRNGLLIFSVQKNKFLYWDSVRVQWSDMAGSSGSYITGKGITGYVPQYTDTATLDTSALYTLGNQLGIGTSSFVYTGSGRTVVELNGTAGGLYGFKRNDSAKGYLFHNGDNMELANTVAGSISFNTNSATRGSIASDGVWRLNNLAGTGDRVVVASSNGTLSAASSATGLVDTLTISTRAWRQKGLDSLAALEVSGSGTTNYVPKFTASSTIGNSQIFDNGTSVGFNTTSPNAAMRLHVVGQTRIDVDSGQAMLTGVVPSFGQVFTQTIDKNGDTRISTNRHLIFRTADVTERLRIFANGRVFVGASPSDAGYQFDVNGTLRAQGGSALSTSIFSNTGPDGGIGVANTGTLAANRTAQLRLFNGTTIFGANDRTYQMINIGESSTAAALLFQYWNGSTYSERFRINSAGDVGINQASPSYKLDVNGTLRSVNGANFATTSGNVGIGTASPALRLHSNSTGAASPATSGTSQTGALRLSNNFSATVLDFGFDINNNAWMQVVNKDNLSIEYPLLINQNGGDVIVGTATDAGSYAFQVSGNIYNTGSAVLAATSGNVGIGTASPANNGANTTTLTINGTNQGILQLQNAGTKYFELYASGTDTRFENVAGNDLTFRNGSTVNARITSAGELLINTTTDAGDYKLQVSGNVLANFIYTRNNTDGLIFGTNSAVNPYIQGGSGNQLYLGTSNTPRLTITSDGELLVNTSTDAGDYKLQVVGNTRVGTGKLDIASNTTFGIGVARSGTSEIAGQIYNSSGILYLGAESSAGGAIFTGSSAYAAVIGSGANYPLQFATNNATRATINTNGELLINTTSDAGDFKLQVNGNGLISGSIKTANGTSSTAAAWHLGSVVATSVQLDTANYVEVEINGTFYRLAIVTPL